jgi:hypothetical protein
MPWSDDASVPGYGVDVAVRPRGAQRSHEPIPHTGTSDRPRLDVLTVSPSASMDSFVQIPVPWTLLLLACG